jgi:hypothetical protein
MVFIVKGVRGAAASSLLDKRADILVSNSSFLRESEDGRHHPLQTPKMDQVLAMCAFPDLDIIGEFIKKGSQVQRKHILLLARHMGLPQGLGNMYNITQNTILEVLQAFISKEQISPANLIFLDTLPFYNRIEALLSHPLYSGAIIMMCCIAPMEKDQEDQIRLEAYLKEINTMDTSPFKPGLDFRCFFGDYHLPLHPTMKPNPQMAAVVHTAIRTWVSTHSYGDRLHYPALSNKLLPSFTRRDMAAYVSALVEEPSNATQGVMEYLYMKYDLKMEGPCEIKQRWYTNGLTPRTYFVCGPTLFEKAKYTKNLWNDLVDSLVVTERRNRVNPRRIHIEGIERALFYDLSTFTSNCAAQREFLSDLARFVEGMPFSYRDSRHGPQTVDFGDVVREYCNTNVQPEYSDQDQTYPGVHGVAGFLGVTGNIATCTFLHGAFLLQLSTSTSKCGCAGDDAVIITLEDDQTIWLCVTLIGVLAREKTFSSEDPDVVYLKRRTWIDESFCRLDMASYIQLPSFLKFMSPTEIRRYRESRFTNAEIRQLSYASLSAFFKSAVPFKNTTAYPDIVTFARTYYRALHLPELGYIPQFTLDTRKRFGGRFIPSISYLGEWDFITGTLESSYPGFCVLPDRPFCTYPASIQLQEDLVYVVVKNPEVTLMVKLGVLEEVRKPCRMLYGQDGLDALLKEYSGHGENSEYGCYKVKVDISDVPYQPTILGEIDINTVVAHSMLGELGPISGTPQRVIVRDYAVHAPVFQDGELSDYSDNEL